MVDWFRFQAAFNGLLSFAGPNSIQISKIEEFVDEYAPMYGVTLPKFHHLLGLHVSEQFFWRFDSKEFFQRGESCVGCRTCEQFQNSELTGVHDSSRIPSVELA